MRNYRIITKDAFVTVEKGGDVFICRACQYNVQMRVLGMWITVKKFLDYDSEYAGNCANELLEKLEETI